MSNVAIVKSNKMTFKYWLRHLGWRHLVAIAALVFALFPIVWMVSASLDPIGDITRQQLIPPHMGLSNFSQLFHNPDAPYLIWLKNSLIVSSVSAILQLTIGSLSAYALSRFRFRGRKATLLSILIIQMFPQILATTAIFVLISQLGKSIPVLGLGSIWALILVYSGGALGINAWMLKGFFDTVSSEIDDSARIDGASHFQIFIRILLPLVTPSLAVVTVLSFIGTLNDYLMANIVLSSNPKSVTLAVGMQGFISNQFDKNWGQFAAGALIMAIPVGFLFLSLQRFIITGLTTGSTKG